MSAREIGAILTLSCAARLQRRLMRKPLDEAAASIDAGGTLKAYVCNYQYMPLRYVIGQQAKFVSRLRQFLPERFCHTSSSSMLTGQCERIVACDPCCALRLGWHPL
jgi:hypothetical protein